MNAFALLEEPTSVIASHGLLGALIQVDALPARCTYLGQCLGKPRSLDYRTALTEALAHLRMQSRMHTWADACTDWADAADQAWFCTKLLPRLADAGIHTLLRVGTPAPVAGQMPEHTWMEVAYAQGLRYLAVTGPTQALHWLQQQPCPA